ncbi:MAG TPA: WXG100 family type VII secretion target [Actinospica sp.]|jgi:WXG100 family type VII secretion target|nr:WXG100 family type VII secretion target [Actinospica sp.]
MAGSSFGTTFDEMNKAAQAVTQTVQDVQAEQRQLMSALEPIAQQWKGQASSAFQQLIQRFNDDASKLTQALDAIGQAISANNKNYSATEEQNNSSISKLLSGLS